MLTVFVLSTNRVYRSFQTSRSDLSCATESWSVVGNKVKCKDILHVEIKLLKLQEVNHVVHVDPRESTCRATVKILLTGCH